MCARQAAIIVALDLCPLDLRPSLAMATKDELAEVKRLASEHDGKAVITAWAGLSSWTRVGLDNGVHGRICGWGMDGPQVEVLEEHWENAPMSKFFPGGNKESNWGHGRTWRFKEDKNANA